MDGLIRDVRYALRSFKRKPGFSLIVVGTLALGVGANATLFSVVSGVLLRPLPYSEPDRLVRLYVTDPEGGGRRTSLSPPDFFDWREAATRFEDMAAYWSPRVNLTGAGEPEQLLAVTCSYNLLDVLRIEPVIGRSLRPEDDVPGAPRVALIGHGLWQRRFGSDPQVVGRVVSLDGMPATVVGVMPRRFAFPGAGTELLLPLRLERARESMAGVSYRAFRILNVVARLKPGVDREEAQAEIATLARRLEDAHPETNRGFGAALETLHESTVGDVKPALIVLSGAVAALLLIACVNLSNLLLARAAARKKEIAIRRALGVGTTRLLRQVLLENLLLALAGGALGLVIASWASEILLRLAPPQLPRLAEVRLDALTLVFTLVVSVSIGLGLGLVPALRALSSGSSAYLRVEGRTTGAHPSDGRARAFLVVSQVALTLVLLAASGLLLQSFRALGQVDPGFRAENVVSVERIELYRSRYREPREWASFFERLLERIGALPGVESAAVTLGLPLGPDAFFYVDRSAFQIEGRTPADPSSPPSAYFHVVSSEYFSALRIPLVKGRAFDPRDRDSAPAVVIINEAMARRFFSGEDPVGRRITHALALAPGMPTTREIVGIVRDVRHFGLALEAEPQMYVPHLQMPWPQMHLVVRSGLGPTTLGPSIRGVVWSLDPNIPVPTVRSMEDVARASVAEPRFRTLLLSLFAGTGLLLATLGVYGVMAYTVSDKAQEMGLRLALGASRRRILAMVVGHALKLTLSGLGLGLAGALLAARLLEGLLFEISPTDPGTLAGVAGVLLAASVVASLLPALRATRVDPLVALRGQ